MSNPRVYGTIVHDGLRHEASGVVDGTFAKKKGGWDTYTVCGKYTGVAVETDGDLVVTCIRCIGRKRHSDYKDILRGMPADVTYIDEAQDLSQEVFEKLLSSVPPEADVDEIEIVKVNGYRVAQASFSVKP